MKCAATGVERRLVFRFFHLKISTSSDETVVLLFKLRCTKRELSKHSFVDQNIKKNRNYETPLDAQFEGGFWLNSDGNRIIHANKATYQT
jgi:hypothetical protein